MNYTQQELKALQEINGLKEEELGTRVATPQELEVFNATIQELWEKGFVVSKDNFLKLWLAFDSSPQVPITRQSILETTKVYRDQYAWKSAEEMEFRKLSGQIGPDQTELVIRQLGRHGLVNTPDTQDTLTNFSTVVRYYLGQGWPITADSFEKAIGNLRTSQGHGSLVYKPTPSQLAQQKRWEDTRTSKSQKSPRQIAEERAAAVRHVRTNDGRWLSDVILEEAPLEQPPQTPSPVSSQDAFWEKQTKDYILHIASNNLRTEAEQLYSHKHHDSWRTTYTLLDHWYERRAPGRPQR